METLNCFFRSVYVPLFLKGKDKRTLAEYRQTISLVVEILDDPTVNEINLLRNQFVEELQNRGAADNTVAKHCRQLNAVFAKLGPKGPRNHDATGRMKYAPHWPLPVLKTKDPKRVSDDEFQALYTAFDHQDDYPKHLPKKQRYVYWQTIMEFVAVTALRREAVLGIEWRNINAKELYLVVEMDVDKKDKKRVKPLTESLLRKLM